MWDELAEQSLLSGLLLEKGRIDIPEYFSENDFYSSKHKFIYHTIFDLINRGLEPNVLTISIELQNLGEIDKAGGQAYIAGLTNLVPSAANAEFFFKTVKNYSNKRLYINIAEVIKENAINAIEVSPSELKETLLPFLDAIPDSKRRKRIATAESYHTECVEYHPEQDFIPSLFAGLRCPNGTISYIGARPGGGKTTAMINIAREALKTERKVFFVNLEMTNKQIITSLILSVMYDIATQEQRKKLEEIQDTIKDYYRLFKSDSSNNTANKVFVKLRKTAIDTINEKLGTQLLIYDGIGNTLENIIIDIKTHVAKGDIALIDYIQRVPAPKNNTDQRYIQIKLISNALLNTALEKEIVVISGAQFGRDKAKNGKEATLEDFREGGDIEQDAHNAISIESPKDTKGGYFIKILKAREGGKEFDRNQLDWHLKYLYMDLTGDKYTVPVTKKQKTKNESSKSIKDKSENDNDIESAETEEYIHEGFL